MKNNLFTLLIALLLISGNAWADTTYPRKMVIEEGTGTWCAWCVRGIVGMAEMKAKYPDTFIGIAVHNRDDMAYDVYGGSLGLSGYPQCNVNRQYKQLNPQLSVMESYYKTITNTPAKAKIELTSATYDIPTNKIVVNSATTFGYTSTSVNCRLVYVVMENGVTSSSKQANAYSGGAYGVMGGWEKLGSSVETLFDDVARGIYPSYSGLAGVIPASVTENSAISHDYTLAMPSSIQNADQVEVVVMLIDVASGEIINADKKHLTVTGTIPATGVSFTESNKTYDLYFNKGQTKQLTAQTIPLYSNEKINWSSTNPAVAKVSTTGLVTAVSEGKVTIYAMTSSGSFTGTCTINSLSYVDVESVALDVNEIEIEVGAQYRFTTTVLPENATNKKLTASTSSSSTVGFVTSGSIIIVGKAVGEATVTLTSNDDNTKKATCKVTVVEAGTGVEEISGENLVSDIDINDSRIVFSLNQAGKATVNLYSTTGRLVHSSVVDSKGQENISIDVPITKGIYILKVSTVKEQFVKKISL